MVTNNDDSTRRPGIGVDFRGDAVVDPTKNVLDLVEAERKRQDDLREAFEKLVQTQMQSSSVIETLRATHTKEMNEAESKRVDQQLALRTSYEERLSLAEAKRIDAIRAVDVNAVAVASQRASDQATVLATQVAQSAEALRGLVASTANTVAQSQQVLSTTLSTRITTLEQAQYEGKGKQSFADPAFAELLAEVKSLRESRSGGSGKAEGISASWGVFLGAAGLLVAAGGFVFIILSSRPSVQPQVIYAPPPALVSPTK